MPDASTCFHAQGTSDFVKEPEDLARALWHCVPVFATLADLWRRFAISARALSEVEAGVQCEKLMPGSPGHV